MARGRHRYIPPRRLLIPLGIGGSAAMAAGAALLTAQNLALMPSLFTAAAAGAAIAGAVLLRHRETTAEERVSSERAAKSAIAYQAEKEHAELEEARDRIAELEGRLQGKRLEMSGLRSEHAELLRRYALAENGRATALEGRRRLALEAAQPTRALPSSPTDHRTAGGKPTQLTYLQAYEALRNLSRNAARQRQLAQQQEREREQQGQGQGQGHPNRPRVSGQPQPLNQAPPPLTRVAPPPVRTRKPAPRHTPALNGGGFDFFGTSGEGGTDNGGGTAPGPGRQPENGEASLAPRHR